MIITCNNCQKQYKIDPEKITERGAKITCPSCGHSFIVKRKAEKPAPKEEAPEHKTPPCNICGNPSTRVLQGDPPMTLCERCFEIEKEKRRRFTAFEPPSEPSEAAEQPDVTRPFQEPATPAEQEDDEDTLVGQRPPEPAEPQAPEKEAPVQDDEYISFDEMPVFTSDGTITSEEPPAEEPTFTPAPSEEEPEPLQPEGASTPTPEMPQAGDDLQYEPPQEPPADTFLSERESAYFEEEAFKSKPEPASLDQETFQPEPGPGLGAEPESFTPDTFIPGESAFEKEVEQSFLKEERDTTAPLGILTPPPPAYQPQSHMPAYLTSAGILFVAILGLVYYLFSQGYLSSFKNIFGEHSSKSTEFLEPAPESPEESPEQEAIMKEALAKKLADQLSTAHRMFLLDTATGYEKAIAEMEAALKIEPGLAEAEGFIMEAYAFYASLKDNIFYNRRAERLIEKASPEVVLRPEYDRARAHVFINQGQGKAARQILSRLLENNPEDAVGLYLLGETYMLDSPPSYEAAEESFNKAVELEHELTRAYWAMGGLYREQKQYQEAGEMYKQVLKHSPNRSEAEDALSELEQKIKVEPPAPVKEVEEPGVARAPDTAPEGVDEKAQERESEPEPVEPEESPDSKLTPIDIETIEKIEEKPGKSEEKPQPAGIEASGDKIPATIMDIISTIEEPLSRVRVKTRPSPAPPSKPAVPEPGTVYPDRPPEEAP
jgi:predicted Zn finger-like uncharacterized protein